MRKQGSFFKLHLIYISVFFLITIVLTGAFYINLLMTAPSDQFRAFQSDSESLVVGKILADRQKVNQSKFGLGFIYPRGSDYYLAYASGQNINNIASDRNISPENSVFSAYTSQFGLQGKVFSTVQNSLGINIPSFWLFNSIFLAIVIVLLSRVYFEIISPVYGTIFLLTMVMSPLLVSFARNLYWVSFTWFLPALFAGLFVSSRDVLGRTFLLIALFGSFLIKCLCGYEYISSVILFAAAPSLYALAKSRCDTWKVSARDFLVICFLGLIGFVAALFLHANLRGDTILDGLRSIYEQDVKRRTFGDPSSFPPVYAASLTASPFTVLKMYVWGWTTDIVSFVPGRAFPILLTLMSAVLFYRVAIQKRFFNQDLALILAFLPVPISWFFLAKSHSFIHTHMNFVLWYLGFIAALFTVISSGIQVIFVRAVHWASKAKPERV